MCIAVAIPFFALMLRRAQHDEEWNATTKCRFQVIFSQKCSAFYLNSLWVILFKYLCARSICKNHFQ